MSFKDWSISLLLHGAAFGAITAANMLHTDSGQEQREVPIYFEVVEAAAIQESSEETTPPPPVQEEEPPAAEVSSQAPAVEEVSAAAEANDIPEEPAEIPDDPVATEVPQERQSAETAAQPEIEPVAQEERAKVVSAPMALNRITPLYPRSSRRKGHEGSVTVEICVAADGGIARAEVVASSGHPELDEAALAAVGTARFAPASEDGVSISGMLRLTFDFRLK